MAVLNNYINQVATNNIYWCDGEAQGKNLPVAFGASVVILDRTVDRMYIKSVDQSGVMTAFRKYAVEEIIDPPAGDYVPKSEFDALKDKLTALESKMESMHNNQQNNNKYNKNSQRN